MRRLAVSTALAVAVYGFAGWVYVALCALVQPNTLHLPLWHLTTWPREDTFGAACFGASFVAFVAYRMLR